MLLLTCVGAGMGMFLSPVQNKLSKWEFSKRKKSSSCGLCLKLEDVRLRRAPVPWTFCVYIMTFIQLYFLTLGPLLVAVTNRWKTPGDVFPISILLHGGWPQGKILMESLSLVIVGRFLFWSYCNGNEMDPEVWYFSGWVLSTIFPNSDHEHLSSL